MTVGSPFGQFPHIISHEVTLRKILPSDVEDLFAIYSDESLFLHSPVMLKKNKDTVAHMVGHFERDFHKGKAIYLGISLEGDPGGLVGLAELFDYQRDTDMITMGYRLNAAYWGKGIATQAVKALTGYLFEVAEVNRVQAFVMPENVKSLGVLRRNGFAQEGIIRQGHVWKGKGLVDLALFAMLKTDYQASKQGVKGEIT